MAKDRVDRDDEDLVRLYLTDIGQYTLLTKDDEVRLAKAIEAGNEAIEQLDAGSELTAAKKRELRRAARQGEEAKPFIGVRPDSGALAHSAELIGAEPVVPPSCPIVRELSPGPLPAPMAARLLRSGRPKSTRPSPP